MPSNLLDPAILFFALGLFAGVVRSNLEIPAPITRFLSLYLLMAIGLKGGFTLAAAGLSTPMVIAILAALLLALLLPALDYLFLSRVVNRFDAAAIAATYGSVSAVTFITAMQFLDHQGQPYGGHMTVAMVLMESPAIFMAIILASLARRRAAQDSATTPPATGIRSLLHEAFTDGGQLLLVGSLLIGALTGAKGEAIMQPFSVDLFKGMLALFLLEMGLQVARQLRVFREVSPLLLAYGIVAPLLHALIALALARLTGMPAGDATLLAVLAASASYIVVPAVLGHAMPEARASLYFGLSLGVTFPFNLVVGIPLYHTLAQRLLG
ncbi:MAG: sodium-dependent bicarbonate transport family permease [Gammaproteobacteria bacterium]